MMPELFDRLLIECHKSMWRYNDRHLAAFCAMPGKYYQKELMIIGRALNGWQFSWEPEDMGEEIKRRDVLDRTLAYSLNINRSLMARLCGDTYNWKRSPFLQLVGRVAAEIGLGHYDNESWADRLLYSNLYKISKHHENQGTTNLNPSRELKQVQLAASAEILTHEIQKWEPKRILFLSGIDWAGPFLTELGAERRRGTDGVLQECGRLLGSPYVVVPHPQGQRGMKRIPTAQKIRVAFNALTGGEAGLTRSHEELDPDPSPTGSASEVPASARRGRPKAPRAEPATTGLPSSSTRRDFLVVKAPGRKTVVNEAAPILRRKLASLFSSRQIYCVHAYRGTCMAAEISLLLDGFARPRDFGLDIIFISIQGGPREVWVRFFPRGRDKRRLARAFETKFSSTVTDALRPIGRAECLPNGPRFGHEIRVPTWVFDEAGSLRSAEFAADLCAKIIGALAAGIPMSAASRCVHHGKRPSPD